MKRSKNCKDCIHCKRDIDGSHHCTLYHELICSKRLEGFACKKFEDCMERLFDDELQ